MLDGCIMPGGWGVLSSFFDLIWLEAQQIAMLMMMLMLMMWIDGALALFLPRFLTYYFGCFFPLPPLQKQRPDPEQVAAAAAAAADKQQKKKKQKDPLGGSLAGQIEQHTAQVAGIMSAATFSSLELSEQTAKGVADMDFTHMTEVQVWCY
jgi:hypothetical protein